MGTRLRRVLDPATWTGHSSRQEERCFELCFPFFAALREAYFSPSREEGQEDKLIVQKETNQDCSAQYSRIELSDCIVQSCSEAHPSLEVQFGSIRT
jgi:hypothetical protein